MDSHVIPLTPELRTPPVSAACGARRVRDCLRELSELKGTYKIEIELGDMQRPLHARDL